MGRDERNNATATKRCAFTAPRFAKMLLKLSEKKPPPPILRGGAARNRKAKTTGDFALLTGASAINRAASLTGNLTILKGAPAISRAAKLTGDPTLLVGAATYSHIKSEAKNVRLLLAKETTKKAANGKRVMMTSRKAVASAKKTAAKAKTVATEPKKAHTNAQKVVTEFKKTATKAEKDADRLVNFFLPNADPPPVRTIINSSNALTYYRIWITHPTQQNRKNGKTSFVSIIYPPYIEISHPNALAKASLFADLFREWIVDMVRRDPSEKYNSSASKARLESE